MGGKLEIEHALWITRGLFGQPLVALEQAYLPATAGQAVGSGATRQAAANYQRFALSADLRRAGVPGFDLAGRRRAFRQAREGPAQDFPLVADSRGSTHLEPGFVQRSAYPPGAGEGTDRRIGRCQTRQLREQFGSPHVRIFCRSKTVEKPCVNARIKLRQLFQHIANQQGESYSPIGQRQGLKPGMNRIIRRQQLFAVRGEFGPQGERALQVVAGQRVFFDADEVQACIRVCDLIKQLPGA